MLIQVNQVFPERSTNVHNLYNFFWLYPASGMYTPGEVYRRCTCCGWFPATHSLPLISNPGTVSSKLSRTNAARAGIDNFCMRVLLDGHRRQSNDVAVYVRVVYVCCARIMARTKLVSRRHPDDEHEGNARRPLQQKRAALTSSSKSQSASSTTPAALSQVSPPLEADGNAVPTIQLPATTVEMALNHGTWETAPEPEQREFVSWKEFIST